MKKFLMVLGVAVALGGWGVAGWQYSRVRAASIELAHARTQLRESELSMDRQKEYTLSLVDWLSSFYMSINALDTLKSKVSFQADTGSDISVASDARNLLDLLTAVKDSPPKGYEDFARKFYDYATESRSIFMAFSANGGRIPYERMERLPTLQAKITDLSFRIWKKSVGEGSVQTSLSTGVIPDFLGQKRDSNPQTFELNGDVGYEDSPVDDMPPPP